MSDILIFKKEDFERYEAAWGKMPGLKKLAEVITPEELMQIKRNWGKSCHTCSEFLDDILMIETCKVENECKNYSLWRGL
ncbi:MAG: hypothetical protein V3U02_06905 [Calditrichia bacterium]